MHCEDVGEYKVLNHKFMLNLLDAKRTNPHGHQLGCGTTTIDTGPNDVVAFVETAGSTPLGCLMTSTQDYIDYDRPCW
jgi:hypothetical protein